MNKCLEWALKTGVLKLVSEYEFYVFVNANWSGPVRQSYDENSNLEYLFYTDKNNDAVAFAVFDDGSVTYMILKTLGA